jgi:hypothetical protein
MTLIGMRARVDDALDDFVRPGSYVMLLVFGVGPLHVTIRRMA